MEAELKEDNYISPDFNHTTKLSVETLDKFQFRGQPFGSDDADYLLHDSAHATQLNVIVSMLQSSSDVLVIKGGRGVGKSTLLHKLSNTPATGLRMALVEAVSGLSVSSICKLALEQLDIPSPEPADDPIEYFRKRVAQRRRSDSKSVLIIDDADELDAMTLDDVIKLRHTFTEDGNAALSLVLSGDERFDASLTALLEAVNEKVSVHTIPLYPFSERQTANYLRQRLASVAPADTVIFTPAQEHLIHTRAKGIPNQIDIEACRLLEMITPNPEPANDENPNWMTPGRIISIATTLAVVAMAVVAVWINRDQLGFGGNNEVIVTQLPIQSRPVNVVIPSQPSAEESEEPLESTPSSNLSVKTKKLEESQVPVINLPVTSVDTTGSTQSNKPSLSKENADDENLDNEVATSGIKVEKTSVKALPNQTAKTVEETAPTQLAVSNKDDSTQTSSLENQSTVATSTTTTPNTAKESEQSKVAMPSQTKAPTAKSKSAVSANEVKAPTWISQQPKSNYTIQVSAVENLRSLQKFQAQYSMLAEAKIVETIRNGKPWYVLVVGSFNNKEDARNALAQLPSNLQKSGAWLRTLGSLQ